MVELLFLLLRPLRRLVASQAFGRCCMAISIVLFLSYLAWDAAAAYAFTGISAHLAGLRAKGDTAAALEIISRQAPLFPATRFPVSLSVLEETVVADLVVSCRRKLREATRAEIEGRTGEAFRLYGDLEKGSPLPVVVAQAKRARARITSSREQAEGLISKGRELEARGDRAGALRVYREVLHSFPGSSASRELRVPLWVETLPAGAQLEVADDALIPSPAWIHWPVRAGVKLRVFASGFRTLEVQNLPWSGAHGKETGGKVRYELEPEILWRWDGAAGRFAEGSFEGGLAVAAGRDGGLRAFRLEPSPEGNVLAWEALLEEAGGAPASQVSSRVEGGAVFSVGPEGFLDVRGLLGGPIPPAGRPPPPRLGAAEVRVRSGPGGAVYRLDRDGLLERRESPEGRVSWRRELGAAAARLETGRDSIAVAGPSGKCWTLDPATGETRREISLPIPGGLESVEEIVPFPPEGRDGPPGPFLIQGRQGGSTLLLAIGPAGELRWRFRLDPARWISLRPVRTDGGERRFLLSGPGLGVQLRAWP